MNKGESQSYQAVCCSPVYQNGAAIKKSMNVLKEIFINLFYNIFRCIRRDVRGGLQDTDDGDRANI